MLNQKHIRHILAIGFFENCSEEWVPTNQASKDQIVFPLKIVSVYIDIL